MAAEDDAEAAYDELVDLVLVGSSPYLLHTDEPCGDGREDTFHKEEEDRHACAVLRNVHRTEKTS
jgi:hypothetical protein